MSGLKSKVLIQIFWSLIDSFGTYVLQFAFSIAIARVLSPSDYGLIGTIVIFLSVGNILSEGGFGMALIQKKQVSKIELSTVFYFNLIMSLVFYGIIFLFANFISEFFDKPILVAIIRVSALTIIIGAVSSIQIVILTRELDFKRQTIISSIATVLSGAVGVIMAYNGYAVWALVFQLLVLTLIKTIGLWTISNWRPSFIFDWQSLLKLNRFGINIFAQGITEILFSKAFFPLIGKIFSTAQLGFYTTASNFSEMIVKKASIAYGRVLFPVLSSINQDTESFKEKYSLIYSLLSLVIIPISIISIIVVPTFVEFALGVKWLQSINLMQLFLLEGFFFVLLMLNQNTFNAMGESDVSLKVDVLKKVLIFSTLLFAFKFGIEALIIGQILSSIAAFLYSMFFIKNKYLIKISVLNYDYCKLLIIGIGIFFIDQFIFQKLTISNGSLLITEIFISPIIYILLIYIFKIKALQKFSIFFENHLPIFIVNIIKFRFK